jgi:hypothetical protein
MGSCVGKTIPDSIGPLVGNSSTELMIIASPNRHVELNGPFSSRPCVVMERSALRLLCQTRPRGCDWQRLAGCEAGAIQHQRVARCLDLVVGRLALGDRLLWIYTQLQLAPRPCSRCPLRGNHVALLYCEYS